MTAHSYLIFYQRSIEFFDRYIFQIEKLGVMLRLAWLKFLINHFF